MFTVDKLRKESVKIAGKESDARNVTSRGTIRIRLAIRVFVTFMDSACSSSLEMATRMYFMTCLRQRALNARARKNNYGNMKRN